MTNMISPLGQDVERNRMTCDSAGEIIDGASRPASLQELQNMAVMGELAVAVAHDFNNIISASLLHLGLLLQDPQLNAEQKESLLSLEQETTRAAGLTRQLLCFSRNRFDLKSDILDLNQLVQGIEKLLDHLVRENIDLSFQPSHEKCWIKADFGQVEKLVMSLCLVLRDVMSRGGRLVLKTSLETRDEMAESAACDGKFVCLTVTAIGSKESLPGLVPIHGDWKLDAARQIAQMHRGWIELAKETPELRLYLPSADHAEIGSERKEIKGGTETILFIEDEPSLRRVSALSLRTLGYAVLDAANSDAALRLWEKHQSNIDLLLTDLRLPGAESGHDLALLFTSQKPSLRVMLSSGNHADLDDRMRLSGRPFFAAVKPYTTSGLAQMVRECLDSPST